MLRVRLFSGVRRGRRVAAMPKTLQLALAVLLRQERCLQLRDFQLPLRRRLRVVPLLRRLQLRLRVLAQRRLGAKSRNPLLC